MEFAELATMVALIARGAWRSRSERRVGRAMTRALRGWSRS